MYISIYIRLYIYIQYIYIYTLVQICTHAYVWVCTDTSVCMYVRTHTYTFIYTLRNYVYIYTHLYRYVRCRGLDALEREGMSPQFRHRWFSLICLHLCQSDYTFLSYLPTCHRRWLGASAVGRRVGGELKRRRAW